MGKRQDERETGQGTANAGPEDSRGRQCRRASERATGSGSNISIISSSNTSDTNRADEPSRAERTERLGGRRTSERSRGGESEWSVGPAEATDVAPVVFYLLKTSSELGAGRIPQLES